MQTVTHPLTTGTTLEDHTATFVRIVHTAGVSSALAALRQHFIDDHHDGGIADWEADFGPLVEAGIEGFRGFDEGHREEHDADREVTDSEGPYADGDDPERECPTCGADVIGNDPHARGCRDAYETDNGPGGMSWEVVDDQDGFVASVATRDQAAALGAVRFHTFAQWQAEQDAAMEATKARLREDR